jgi:hypothetical protein
MVEYDSELSVFSGPFHGALVLAGSCRGTGIGPAIFEEV